MLVHKDHGDAGRTCNGNDPVCVRTCVLQALLQPLSKCIITYAPDQRDGWPSMAAATA